MYQVVQNELLEHAKTLELKQKQLKEANFAQPQKPVEEVIEGGPRSVVGVFSLADGKVGTQQAIGTQAWPMWEGEGKVRKARLIDMETLEVMQAQDF